MIFSLAIKSVLRSFSRCQPISVVKNSFASKSKAKLLDLLAAMPKEKPHIPKMQAQRQLKKTVKTKYPPGIVTLQVLGSGARGAPRSLYIFTDQSCYIFNAGEGSQRLAHEHKLKLAKVEHIFFTRSSWGNIGGLPGISLTIQDVGVPHITLHGPPGLGQFFEAASRFIILKDLHVNHVDATCSDAFFEDSVMKVSYVPVESSSEPNRSNTNSPIEEEEVTNYYCKEIPNNDGEAPVSKRTRIDLSCQKSSKSAISYICRVHPKHGTLLAEKCVELGVPPGPLYGQLKAGNDITLPDGKVVLAKDVRSPDDPGPVFLVVECPSEAYLENFVNNPELAKLQAANGASELDSPQVVVHFTPMQLVNHPRYQEWLDRFAFGTQHMYLGYPENETEHRRGLGSVAVHRIQHQLNLIDPELFPLLWSDMRTEQEPETNDCQTLTAFHLRPLKKLDVSSIPRINPQEYVNEVLNQEGLQSALDQLKTTLADAIPRSGRKYPKFTFLGTGSCIPNKTRNTSAILVELEKDRFMLMDCGEGTYGQIVRLFGYERSTRILSNLVGVYISHLHADHHIGLIGLLQGRQHSFDFTKTSPEPVALIAPKQIIYWLKTYSNDFEKIRHCFELIPALNLKDTKADCLLLKKLNAESITTTYVRHCPNAFGVSIVTADGFKFTYSGDTMPCQSLVEIGKDSDLLIHEATMEDGMEDEAKLKTHCTTSQAIQVGRDMNAKFTLLTHFSQRYSKIPKFNDRFSSKTVGVAFDNMQVSPDGLHRLPYFIPVLKQMFAESFEDMEAKTMKRNLRLLREENQKK